MKNKIINNLVVFLSLFSLVELIINKELVFSNISYSLKLWINSIIPSLFPFFVISDILINYNITSYIPRNIKNIFSYLFKTSDNVTSLFFLSMLSGFPSSGRNVRLMYDYKLISTDEANRFLMFSHFSNPLFILGTVAIFYLKDSKLGLVVLISHYIPNILIAFFTRNCNYNVGSYKCKDIPSINKSFPIIFSNAIKNAISSLLMILGTLSCFLVISSFVLNILTIDSYSGAIVKGLLEITMGLNSLCLLKIDNLYKVVISSMFLSFGGFSIHMQILSFLADTDISYKPFFISRIYHSCLSGLIAYFLYIVFI